MFGNKIVSEMFNIKGELPCLKPSILLLFDFYSICQARLLLVCSDCCNVTLSGTDFFQF